MATINFTGVSDVINSVIVIVPDIINLVISIVPLKITLAIIEMIVGIFLGIKRDFE